MVHSEDGGKTWAFLSQAVETIPAKGGLGVWEPFFRTGADGKIELTYSSDLSASNGEIFRTKSSDAGKTWSAGVNMQVHNDVTQQWRDGMSGIIAITDTMDNAKCLVQVFQTDFRVQNGARLFSVAYAVSCDDGATWPDRCDVYVPKMGRNAGSPQIAIAAGSGIVVSFMTDEDSATVGWPAYSSIKIVTGPALYNRKIQWGPPALVQGTTSSWPGLLTIGKTALSVYSNNGNIVGKVLSWPGA